jgi:hypothetical protein
MNKALLVVVLLASCGNVTPLSVDAGGGAGQVGATGGAPGTGGATAAGGAAGTAGVTGTGGTTGGTGGAPALPGCTTSGSSSIAVTWCGHNCGSCSGYLSPCTFPQIDVTDANGSTATCDLDTELTSPDFTLQNSSAGWRFLGGTLSTSCKTIPAFACTPSASACAACP